MKRITALDFARVVAMVAVIVIHVSSTYINAPSDFALFGMNLGFILNQVTRFSVPLFILLSGLSLGLHPSQRTYGDFLKQRAWKIGLPYILWFVIYGLYSGDFVLTVRSLLLGHTAPHLYFIGIIAQFYLLYPLLKRWVDTRPVEAVAWSWLVGFVVQSAYVFQAKGHGVIPTWIYPYLYILFPTWMFYFVTGMAITKKRLAWLKTKAVEHRVVLGCMLVVWSGLYVAMAKATQSLGAIQTSLNGFVPLVLVTCLWVWDVIGKYGWVEWLTVYLSGLSMTIYFSHVLVLTYFRDKIGGFTGMGGMVKLLCITTAVSILFAMAIDGCNRLWKRKS